MNFTLSLYHILIFPTKPDKMIELTPSGLNDPVVQWIE